MSLTSHDRLKPIEVEFGRLALSWLLGREAASAPIDSVPSEGQALEILDQVAKQMRQLANPYEREMRRAEALSRYLPDLGTSLALAVRAMCGGTLPEPASTEDHLVRHVTILAADLYVTSLLPRQHRQADMNDVSTFGHPSAFAIQQAILDDPAFASLFPQVPPAPTPVGPPGMSYYDIHSQVIWSNGSGGGLGLANLPSSLARYVIALARIRRMPFDRLTEVASDAVDAARSLGRAEWTLLPVVSSISNITLRDDSEAMPIGSGHLYSTAESRWVLPVLDGASTAVLVTPQLVKLLRVEPDSSSLADPEAPFTKAWTTPSEVLRSLSARVGTRSGCRKAGNRARVGRRIHRCAGSSGPYLGQPPQRGGDVLVPA